MPTEGKIAFTLPAVVTIREIAAVHGQLREATGQGAVGAIDCTAVDDADITLFQLLAAARLAAGRAGRPLDIIWPQDGRLVALLRLSGLFEHLH